VIDQEVKINLNVNKDDDNANAEQSAEAQAAPRKREGRRRGRQLGADLEELRQTLCWRQADFDNYRSDRKRGFEDSKARHGSRDRRGSFR